MLTFGQGMGFGSGVGVGEGVGVGVAVAHGNVVWACAETTIESARNTGTKTKAALCILKKPPMGEDINAPAIRHEQNRVSQS